MFEGSKRPRASLELNLMKLYRKTKTNKPINALKDKQQIVH